MAECWRIASNRVKINETYIVEHPSACPGRRTFGSRSKSLSDHLDDCLMTHTYKEITDNAIKTIQNDCGAKSST